MCVTPSRASLETALTPRLPPQRGSLAGAAPASGTRSGRPSTASLLTILSASVSVGLEGHLLPSKWSTQDVSWAKGGASERVEANGRRRRLPLSASRTGGPEAPQPSLQWPGQDLAAQRGLPPALPSSRGWQTPAGCRSQPVHTSAAWVVLSLAGWRFARKDKVCNNPESRPCAGRRGGRCTLCWEAGGVLLLSLSFSF